MFKKRILLIAAAVVALVAIPAIATAAGGFDQFGYNRQARVFSGPADGVDGVLDGKVWGDPTYANDHLVMKWNAEWDRGNLEHWAYPPYAAWLNNEWNGNVPGGSGVSEIVKIVWDAGCAASQPPPAGGYCIWGQFAALMDHYPSGAWYAHADPTGYGAYR